MGSTGRDPFGDAEPFGIESPHLPESLLRPPEGAEPLGAFAAEKNIRLLHGAELASMLPRLRS